MSARCLFLLPLAFLSGCHKQDTVCLQPAIRQSLQQLRPNQAPQDAERAHRLHDDQFLGVNGYGVQVPGVQDETTLRRHGVRVIEGTSDGLCDDDHDRLNKQAQQYAERYNRAMMAMDGTRE